MLSIDCYIGLETTAPLDRELILSWFGCVRQNAPDGVLRTVQTTDDGGALRSVALVSRQQEGRHAYLVPLSRNLTETEGEAIMAAYEAPEGTDFDVTMTSSYGELVNDAEVISIEDERYMELCTAWAKRQHETWMSDRVAGGWRYGPNVSMSQRTHPMIKQWADLPAEHRGVDAEAPGKMVALLNASGYAVISQGELDAVMALLKTRAG